MIRQRLLKTSRLLREPDWVREPPSMRFSPTAWAKLLYLRNLGDSEVGGFGIARPMICSTSRTSNWCGRLARGLLSDFRPAFAFPAAKPRWD